MIRAYVMNAVSLAALRFLSPLRAAGLVARLARVVPAIEEAKLAATIGGLRGGTCLSRSMAIAALSERAEVVIGVPPPEEPNWTAHAWVEVDRVPVLASEVRGAAITRFSVRISSK